MTRLTSLAVAFASMALAGGFAAGLGAKPVVGTPFDLQGFIDSAVQAGAKEIVVPTGRYRVTPRNRQHLVLDGLHDIMISAEGVEMICTETTRAVTVKHCSGMVLRGLTIDYDPLPFTQGRITGLSADKKIHDVTLAEGYPPAGMARAFKYEIFRPDSRTLRCDDRYPDRIEVIDARRLRIHCPGGRAENTELAGDLIVLGTEYAPHGSVPHAIECDHDTNVRLENIRLFSSNCFGFIESDCECNVYSGCCIDRRPADDDFIKRADPRLRSLNADAFHSKHAVKGPVYDHCVARFMGDDAVNINGDYHMVMASSGRELRVLAKQDMNMCLGDPVEIVQYTGERLPDAKVTGIETAGGIRDDERAFLSNQRLDAGLKSGHGALEKAFRVTLDREIVLARGGVICAANRTGTGFVVRNCDFGCNRSRGILIKASHGEVCDNVIKGSRMSAILVAPEYWWLEAGCSSDLKITGNTIRDCLGIPICVEAIAGNGDIAPYGAHRAIVIRGNTVRNCPMPGILVTSSDRLVIENNALGPWSDNKNIPRQMQMANDSKLRPVVLIHCKE